MSKVIFIVLSFLGMCGQHSRLELKVNSKNDQMWKLIKNQATLPGIFSRSLGRAVFKWSAHKSYSSLVWWMFLTTVVPIIRRTVVGSAPCVRRWPDCALCGPGGRHMGTPCLDQSISFHHMMHQHYVCTSHKIPSSCTAGLVKADQTAGAPVEEDGVWGTGGFCGSCMR